MTPRVPAHQHLWSRPIAGLALVAVTPSSARAGVPPPRYRAPRSRRARPRLRPPSRCRAPVGPPTRRRLLQTYVVAKGDTFSMIAQRFGVTVEGLLAANPSLKNPNKISVGDGIVIPTPRRVRSRRRHPTSPLSRRRPRRRSRRPSPRRSRRSPIDPGPLRVDGFADVLVTDLAIRSKASVATDSKVLGRLTTGDRVFILKGPVEGSGFAWYQRRASEYLTAFSWTGEAPVGWIAAGESGRRTVARGPRADCPRLPVEGGARRDERLRAPLVLRLARRSR